MKIIVKDTKLSIRQIGEALQILADLANKCESVEQFQDTLKIMSQVDYE